MNRNIFAVAFFLGAMAVVWVGVGFVGLNTLALVMTVLIGAVYVFGARELQEFRRATSSLTTALAGLDTKSETMPTLTDWLGNVHPALQNPVRLRIEGERIGLPGPALTPYLVGLLVMLGMLGTFLGMVVTFNGAVFALEGTTDLNAIRSALAAPIKGLGLAFGTSVAGVAASAMLGLMSAFSRHERLLAAQSLDTHIATVLQGFSLSYQRQETYKALQSQSRALPEVAEKLQTLMAQIERREQQLNERLLSNQENFHREVSVAYTNLASAVEKSLKETLSESARLASANLQPVLETAMTGLAADAKSMHDRMIEATQAQLAGISTRFSVTADAVAESWTGALAKHEATNNSLVSGLDRSLSAFNQTFEQGAASLLASVKEASVKAQATQVNDEQQRLNAWTQSLATVAAGLQREWQEAGAQTLAQQAQICTALGESARNIAEQSQTNARNTLTEITRLLASSEALIQSRIDSEAAWTKHQGERMNELAALWRSELAALRDEEAQRGSVAVDRLSELQTTLTLNLSNHLAMLGAALEGPITRLVDSASEAPRAAAEVIGQLRQEISNNMARDNALLEERSRILETLNTLLDSIKHASTEQRSTIDALVASSAAVFNQAGSQFAEQVGAETAKISSVAAHVTSSAIEVSSLSESFSFAVKLFTDGNEKLIASLQKIEATMDKSTARSDEQLAYYVAQAREIIDLSIMSQKEVVDELRQLSSPQSLTAAEVI